MQMQGNNDGELPPFLDQKAACEALGISRWTFYELARRGELPGAFRLGGKLVRVHTASLLAAVGRESGAGEAMNGEAASQLSQGQLAASSKTEANEHGNARTLNL